ncbi:MAG: hypothetical protein ACE5I3_14390 [Phycisphaerae bacterium]
MFTARHVSWQAAAVLLVSLALSGGCPQETGPPDQTAGPNATTDATSENNPPIAHAGADQTASAGDLVVLDGTGSSDADADQLVFVWRQISGEPGIVLEDGFSSRPRFFVPSGITEETVLTFRLTVVDGFAVDFDEVTVTIRPEADAG